MQQHVIERLAALLGGGDRDVQVLADAILADVLVELARPQPRFVLRVVVDARRGRPCDRPSLGQFPQRLLQRALESASEAVRSS